MSFQEYNSEEEKKINQSARQNSLKSLIPEHFIILKLYYLCLEFMKAVCMIYSHVFFTS